MTPCKTAGLAAIAICEQRLQCAAPIVLDLAELMCYTKKVIGSERSGFRGKLATDKAVDFLQTTVSNRCLMAGLPCKETVLDIDGMMLSHRSGFFYQEA